MSANTQKKSSATALRVVVSWNGTVIQERTLSAPSAARRVTIGESTRNDLVVSGVHVPETAVLFARAPSGYELNILEGMGGRIHLGEETLSASDFAGRSLLVAPGSWGLLRYSGVTIYFQFVAAETLPRRPLLGGLDSAVLVAMWFSFLVQLSFVFVAQVLWDEALAAEEYTLSDRVLRIVAVIPPDPIPEEDPPPELDSGPALEGSRDSDPADVPDQERVVFSEASEESGRAELGEPMMPRGSVLEGLRGARQQSAALDAIFSDFDIAGGMDTEFRVGGGDGDFSVAGRTRLGRGRCGDGEPCHGDGTGFGNLGQIGGIERGDGRGVRAEIATREQRPPRGRVRTERAIQRGDFLSGEQVRDVVRRHSRGIRHCYESQLLHDRSLEGRVVLNWTVDLDGTIARSSVESNETGNEAIERCLLREVGRMRFPEPDGGMVVVSFPFVFQSRD